MRRQVTITVLRVFGKFNKILRKLNNLIVTFLIYISNKNVFFPALYKYIYCVQIRVLCNDCKINNSYYYNYYFPSDFVIKNKG